MSRKLYKSLKGRRHALPSIFMKKEDDDKERGQMALKFGEATQPKPEFAKNSKITSISDAKKRKDRLALIEQLGKSGVFG